MNEKNKKDEKQSFLIYKDKKLVKLRDELNSLQDEWNKKIRHCENKDERECLEEMLSISLKELSNKIALKEKDIYRIKKSTFKGFFLFFYI